jgi:hypothetical protein
MRKPYELVYEEVSKGSSVDEIFNKIIKEISKLEELRNVEKYPFFQGISKKERTRFNKLRKAGI